MTDVTGNPEEERRTEFYQAPWVPEAVSRYVFSKVTCLIMSFHLCLCDYFYIQWCGSCFRCSRGDMSWSRSSVSDSLRADPVASQNVKTSFQTCSIFQKLLTRRLCCLWKWGCYSQCCTWEWTHTHTHTRTRTHTLYTPLILISVFAPSWYCSVLWEWCVT